MKPRSQTKERSECNFAGDLEKSDRRKRIHCWPEKRWRSLCDSQRRFEICMGEDVIRHCLHYMKKIHIYGERLKSQIHSQVKNNHYLILFCLF